MKLKLLAALNSLAFIGVLTVNSLANILPINGLNTGQVSDLYPSLFTPAGITFSIWSIIYLYLSAFVIFQWRIRERVFFLKFSIWFLISCAANASWILVWHHLMIVTSLLIMLILLFSLVKIFLLLQSQKLSRQENIFILIPFTIYFAWICVASIANSSALLVSLHWNGSPLSSSTWTMLLLIIAASLSSFIAVRFNAAAHLLVTIWAFFGIYLRWSNSEYVGIASTALILIILLTLLFLVMIIKPEPFSKLRNSK